MPALPLNWRNCGRPAGSTVVTHAGDGAEPYGFPDTLRRRMGVLRDLLEPGRLTPVVGAAPACLLSGEPWAAWF
jgi:hypothetical protein